MAVRSVPLDVPIAVPGAKQVAVVTGLLWLAIVVLSFGMLVTGTRTVHTDEDSGNDRDISWNKRLAAAFGAWSFTMLWVCFVASHLEGGMPPNFSQRSCAITTFGYLVISAVQSALMEALPATMVAEMMACRGPVLGALPSRAVALPQ